MNVRVLRQEESKIRCVDFGQHVLGAKPTHYHPQRPEKYAHNNHTNNSQLRSTRNTDHQREKLKNSRLAHRQAKVATANSPAKHSPLFFEEQDDLSPQQGEQVEQKQDPGSKKHLQFIRSYQVWLKDTMVEGYQTARMTNSLGFKKTRASHRSARRDQGLDNQLYQMQINRQYKQGNLFPCRRNPSLKKLYKKPDKLSSQCHLQKKHEGELKMKLLKSTIRKETPQGERKSPTRPRGMERPHSALLRNFSNPKILMIENRQLVTGTKIMLL